MRARCPSSTIITFPTLGTRAGVCAESPAGSNRPPGHVRASPRGSAPQRPPLLDGGIPLRIDRRGPGGGAEERLPPGRVLHRFGRVSIVSPDPDAAGADIPREPEEVGSDDLDETERLGLAALRLRESVAHVAETLEPRLSPRLALTPAGR